MEISSHQLLFTSPNPISSSFSQHFPKQIPHLLPERGMALAQSAHLLATLAHLGTLKSQDAKLQYLSYLNYSYNLSFKISKLCTL